MSQIKEFRVLGEIIKAAKSCVPLKKLDIGGQSLCSNLERNNQGRYYDPHKQKEHLESFIYYSKVRIRTPISLAFALFMSLYGCCRVFNGFRGHKKGVELVMLVPELLGGAENEHSLPLKQPLSHRFGPRRKALS